MYSAIGHTSKTKNRLVQNCTYGGKFCEGVNVQQEEGSSAVNQNAVKRYSRRDSVGSGMCPDEARVMAKASQIVMYVYTKILGVVVQVLYCGFIITYDKP